MGEKKRKNRKQLEANELSAFCGQLSLIVSSGLSISEGIEIMCDDAETSEEKAILEDIRSQLEIGESLKKALGHSGVFPQYLIHMVATGERTGNLDKVMAMLESHYDREDDVRRSIYQAVIYPVILSAMVIAVIMVLLVQVMPVFERIFRELGTEISGAPMLLMQAGKAISGVGFVILAVLVVAAIVLLVMGRSDWGEAQTRSMLRSLPGLAKSSHAEASCRFAGHMALVLSSGLSAEEGVSMAREMTDNQIFLERLKTCSSLMTEGTRFSDALLESKIFSGIYAQLISTGARTGNIDKAMSKVADLYQEEIDEQLSRRISRIEPALIILLAFIVGGILLSVMMPLLNIMAAI